VRLAGDTHRSACAVKLSEASLPAAAWPCSCTYASRAAAFSAAAASTLRRRSHPNTAPDRNSASEAPATTAPWRCGSSASKRCLSTCGERLPSRFARRRGAVLAAAPAAPAAPAGALRGSRKAARQRTPHEAPSAGPQKQRKRENPGAAQGQLRSLWRCIAHTHPAELATAVPAGGAAAAAAVRCGAIATRSAVRAQARLVGGGARHAAQHAVLEAAERGTGGSEGRRRLRRTPPR
jgi:hypothetical protein